MFLDEYVRCYAQAHDISAGTVDYHKFAVRVFQRWAGRRVPLAELSDDLLNRWLTEQLDAGTLRETLKSQRGSIMTLWRAAVEDDAAVPQPRKVKVVKIPPRVILAWNADQVRRIIEATSLLRGKIRRHGIPRAVLARSLYIKAYYAGLRPCDLLAVTTGHVSPDGLLRFVQQKTNVEHRVVLPVDALAAMRATFPPERELIYPVGRKALDYWWQKIKKATGVPGSMKWFRRSGATHVEALYPGAAMGFLGHKTPGLAYKHYVDRSQLPFEQRLPPPLLV